MKPPLALQMFTWAPERLEHGVLSCPLKRPYVAHQTRRPQEGKDVCALPAGRCERSTETDKTWRDKFMPGLCKRGKNSCSMWRLNRWNICLHQPTGQNCCSVTNVSNFYAPCGNFPVPFCTLPWCLTVVVFERSSRRSKDREGEKDTFTIVVKNEELTCLLNSASMLEFNSVFIWIQPDRKKNSLCLKPDCQRATPECH